MPLLSIFKNTIKAQTLEESINNVSYAIGLDIAKSLQESGLDIINIEQLALAMQHLFNGEPTQISIADTKKVINDYFAAKGKIEAQAAIEMGERFLQENKKKEGVVVLPSGLQYMVITEGSGKTPSLTSKVTTHYHGTLINGEVFDSSVQRNSPATFPVNGVIKGWTEALQLMKEGSKWRLFIPSELAYGDRGAGGSIGPGATLIFEVELIKIES